ncbi:serine palmitoyltransferase 2 [Magnaporthiopsis poae ATCC 64411]|uniref:serine C-palmitoyltransferase n=1 Tax=Magnaporthiopsis poae (strain ATCC 64411 / 73-15) TaxID=644358 RepID=A0A0C4DXX9_MAGP6|nr:serine palmitoyltransferase 2 [Magnaporthiopsis poae ATCC 64411]
MASCQDSSDPLVGHPHVSQISKLQELARLGMTRLQVALLSNPVTRVLHSSPSSYQPSPWSGHKHGPLSGPGLFNSHYIEPMFLWQVDCVNGASHNYAGSYLLNEFAEALHKLCLDKLPVTLDSGMLLDAVHEEIARFWSADFAMTTSTGYGANYLAMPALLAMLRDKGRVAVFRDEHCHNSIFTGVYLGMGRLGGVTLGRFAHNNAAMLGKMLDATSPDTIKLVVIEGLYSMEGDVPPLPPWPLSRRNTTSSSLRRGTRLSVHCLPRDLIDIRTGTLSKAVGGIGGYVAGKSAFAQHLSSHPQQPVSTATLVQTLWVIRQPLLARRNLSRLSATAAFCRRELGRLGVYTYGSSNTPVVPVWTGRSSVSTKFPYELRRRGVLASPITTPAVPFWESRVRVNLSADFPPEDPGSGSKVPTPAMVGTSDIKMPELPAETLQDEARSAFDGISRLILQTSREVPPHYRPALLTAAGHASRHMYGMASGGSRWISGTYPPHMTAEDLIAARTGTEAAMTFKDPGISLDSTVAALARPVSGAKRHVMLFPESGSRCIEDGLVLVPPALARKGRLQVLRYADVESAVRCVREAGVPKRTCVTVYIELGDCTNLLQTRTALCEVAQFIGRKTPLTILLHDARSPSPDMFHVSLVPAGERIHAAVFGICAAADARVAYLAGRRISSGSCDKAAIAA